MPHVTFIEADGSSHELDATPDRTLMQTAADNGIPGLLGDCGGSCSCGTCHAYIGAPWRERLPPVSESESFMLDGVLGRREDSRLCCQITLTQALDGIVVHVPVEQA